MAASNNCIGRFSFAPIKYPHISHQVNAAVKSSLQLRYPAHSFAGDNLEMQEVPDITDSETWTIRTTLRERYKEDMELQIADAEIRLRASDRELTSCPVWYWQKDGCHFVIFKTGTRRYRSQFFYRAYQQFGTGTNEYSDIAECAVSLLQAQADYEAKQRGDL